MISKRYRLILSLILIDAYNIGKYKLFEKVNACLCDFFSNLGSYLTTTWANGPLLTLLIIIIEATAERCSEP